MTWRRLVGALVCCAAAVGAAATGAGFASAPEGEKMTRASDVERIDASVLVRATPAEVWRAWTADEGAREFFAQDTNIRLEIGGPYEILFNRDAPEGERGSEGCRVLSYLPEEMLSFSWNAPPQFKHARGQRTWVVVRMEPAEGGTRVRLTHLGWTEKKALFPEHAAEWGAVRAYFERAWPFVLENLRKRFDEGAR